MSVVAGLCVDRLGMASQLQLRATGEVVPTFTELRPDQLATTQPSAIPGRGRARRRPGWERRAHRAFGLGRVARRGR
jgi:hypothetical protein